MTASAGLSPILVKVETLGQVEEGESQAPAPPVSVQPQTAAVTAAPAALIGGNLRSLSATSSCLISALEVTGLGFGSLAARPPRQRVASARCPCRLGHTQPWAALCLSPGCWFAWTPGSWVSHAQVASQPQ